MTSNDLDYYADLNLTPTATHSQIRAAFHTLARRHHPDKTRETDSSAFRCAREAYEKLSDARFRAEYDGASLRSHMGFAARHDDELTGTRTEAFEAEQAEEAARSEASSTAQVGKLNMWA